MGRKVIVIHLVFFGAETQKSPSENVGLLIDRLSNQPTQGEDYVGKEIVLWVYVCVTEIMVTFELPFYFRKSFNLENIADNVFLSGLFMVCHLQMNSMI